MVELSFYICMKANATDTIVETRTKCCFTFSPLLSTASGTGPTSKKGPGTTSAVSFGNDLHKSQRGKSVLTQSKYNWHWAFVTLAMTYLRSVEQTSVLLMHIIFVASTRHGDVRKSGCWKK